jgi:long-chain fatty acid transport protein
MEADFQPRYFRFLLFNSSPANSKALRALSLVEEFTPSDRGARLLRMKHRRETKSQIDWRLTTILLLNVSGTTLFADGFRLPDQDAFATARGEAFVATADNASAVYYNPAGLSQLEGWNFRAGIYGIYLPMSYESPNGRTYDNKKPLQAAPQIFGAYKPEGSPFTFGLGIYAPFGLGLKWPQDSGFRTVGTESQLTYLSFNPVVAWQISPKLSVAAGMTVNYASADLRSGLVWPDQHNDEFRFKGDGWDVGYNLGVLWRVHEKVSLGVSFRSSTSFDLDGHTAYYNNVAFGPVPAFPKQRVNASARVPFPLNAVFGISYRPTTNWNFEFNADYTDWSPMDTVTIKQGTGFGSLLPKDIPGVLNWQPAWYYKFGGTRYLEKGWQVSAGYIYSENAVPDSHYTPLVADAARHWLSLGTGHKGRRFDFDIAYQFGFGDGTRTVSGSAPSATGQTADGRYNYISHAVLATVGFHF